MLSRRSFALAVFGLAASTVIPGSPTRINNLSGSEDGKSDTSGIDLRRTESLILEQTNQIRRERRSLPAFDHNARLESAARAHAEDMADENYFSHTSLDGETQQDRYSWCRGGENIAQTWVNRSVETADGFVVITSADELADQLMSQWLNSEPHREDGLFGSWTKAAPAVARSEDKIYAVLAFCA